MTYSAWTQPPGSWTLAYTLGETGESRPWLTGATGATGGQFMGQMFVPGRMIEICKDKDLRESDQKTEGEDLNPSPQPSFP